MGDEWECGGVEEDDEGEGAGDDEEADEYADEADGADDVGSRYDAAVQY